MPDGLQLGEVAELEAQMLSLEQMFIRIPNVQFSTEPAIFQPVVVSAHLSRLQG